MAGRDSVRVRGSVCVSGMCRRLCAEAHLSPGPAPSTACSSRPGITAPGRALPGQIPSSPSLGLERLGCPVSRELTDRLAPRCGGRPCSLLPGIAENPRWPPQAGDHKTWQERPALARCPVHARRGFRASCSTLGSPLGWAPGQRGHSPSRKQFPRRGRPRELPSALPGGRRGWVTRARRPARPSLPPSTLRAGGGRAGAGGAECQRRGLPSLASPGGDFGAVGGMGEERGP